MWKKGGAMRRLLYRLLLTVILLATAVSVVPMPHDFSCSPLSAAEIHADTSGPLLNLPEPSHNGGASLEKSIFRRTSERSFSKASMPLKDASQLLWAAGGVTVDGIGGATRSYPAAGGLYPLVFYLVADSVTALEPGVYRYVWDRHGLQKMKGGAVIDEVKSASYSGAFINGYCPACIVVTAVESVTTSKYGVRGKERYVPMAAGFSGQNIQLQAYALGLGSYVIGAFDDRKVIRAVAAGTGEVPLAIIPFGQRGDD